MISIQVRETEEVKLKLNGEKIPIGTDDYEELKNKPKLNGKELIGEIKEEDPTVPDWAKKPNKPSYKHEEVGAVGEDEAITLQELTDIFNSMF